jgi:hypothetical protein
MAVSDHGFEPDDRYLSKCDLCFDIRRYLLVDKKLELRELQPQGHYENA